MAGHILEIERCIDAGLSDIPIDRIMEEIGRQYDNQARLNVDERYEPIDGDGFGHRFDTGPIPVGVDPGVHTAWGVADWLRLALDQFFNSWTIVRGGFFQNLPDVTPEPYDVRTGAVGRVVRDMVFEIRELERYINAGLSDVPIDRIMEEVGRQFDNDTGPFNRASEGDQTPTVLRYDNS